MTNSAVRVFAPAKINLFLHVGEKRNDGFHALQSLVVFAEAGDELALRPANNLKMRVDGPFASALSGEDNNLVLKAVRAFAERLSVAPNADIVLTKNLPVSSGIGGGSADAAATLRGLRPLWERPGGAFIWGHWEPFADRQDDYQAAQEIGSDVPVCLLSGPAWMEGRGEKVWSLDGPSGTDMVLVNPGVVVPTVEIFRRLERRTGVAEKIPSGWGHNAHELVAYLADTMNDLEAPACALYPVIRDVLQAMAAQEGVLLARMSGSGATCFALFEDSQTAARAANAIAALNTTWWVRTTRIASSDIGRPRPAI